MLFYADPWKKRNCPRSQYRSSRMQKCRIQSWKYVEKLLTSTLCPNTEFHSLRAGLSPHKAQKPSKAGKHRMYFLFLEIFRNSLICLKKTFVSSENDSIIFFILKQENMQKPCKVFKPLFQSMKALKCFKLYQRSAQGWRGPGQMARKNVVLMGYNLFKETTPEIS